MNKSSSVIRAVLCAFGCAIIAVSASFAQIPTSTFSKQMQTAQKPDFICSGPSGASITIGTKVVQPGATITLNCSDALSNSGGKYNFNVKYTLLNQGPGEATNAVFHNKAYDDGTVISDWHWGMTTPTTVPVGIPHAYSASMPLSVGTHVLTILLDDGNAIPEVTETNNNFVVTYTLVCPQQQTMPDITSIRGITLGGQPGGAGGHFVPWGGSVSLTKADAFQESNGKFAFNISYDMKNIGGGATSPAFTNRGLQDGSMVTQQTALVLLAGESKIVNTQAYLDAGKHTFNLRLDATNAVTESSEGNNSFTITFLFTP